MQATIAQFSPMPFPALISEAGKLSGLSSKDKIIETALQFYIKYQKRLRLIEMAGKVPLDIDLDTLRGRDNADHH
jgi:hypothetical protein